MALIKSNSFCSSFLMTQRRNQVRFHSPCYCTHFRFDLIALTNSEFRSYCLAFNFLLFLVSSMVVRSHAGRFQQSTNVGTYLRSCHAPHHILYPPPVFTWPTASCLELISIQYRLEAVKQSFLEEINYDLLALE